MNHGGSVEVARLLLALAQLERVAPLEFAAIEKKIRAEAAKLLSNTRGD